MKATIAALTAATSILLIAGGYVYSEYAILSKQDIAEISQYITVSQNQAYQIGKLSCNKGS